MNLKTIFASRLHGFARRSYLAGVNRIASRLAFVVLRGDDDPLHPCLTGDAHDFPRVEFDGIEIPGQGHVSEKEK
jgi:hypothetical protein